MIGKNKIGDYNIVYDGEPLSDHFIIKSMEMPLLPTIGANTAKIGGRPGLWFSSRKIETRTITIHAAMMNDNNSRIDMMEKWLLQTKYLAKEKECKLELGGGYFVNAILIGDTPLKRENGRWSEVTLDFVCYDPYIYGEEHVVEFKSSNSVAFDIISEQPVYPSLVLSEYQPFDMVYIEHKSYGDYTGTIKTNKFRAINIEYPWFVVDMENHTCEYNGLNVEIDPSVSDFFYFLPGSNSINTYGAKIKIEYREKFL